ncbi:preprotein translocase subunit SecE [Mycoplasma sp. Pen4]|uniref:preprotein translocase subunit SecE n=1 Tax=Mycoplasma sp. Pen4 TaxID=640330 RepID=UPI00165449BF|nr:preprotein translocase subunit SecE [Mycoplasma sp. Pen4]QNM93355.1 preprotein translocase subunit SecE [Mycoplasma sp. Pen4]
MSQNSNTQLQNNSQKPPRKKIYFFRKVVKDIKRVRWPSAKTNWHNMIKIIVFTILFTLFVYGVSIGFTHLWSILGSTPTN